MTFIIITATVLLGASTAVCYALCKSSTAADEALRRMSGEQEED